MYANIYRDKQKVVPVMVKATEKPKEAVEYAIDVETRNCVWSVNEGFDRARTEWTVQNDVDQGDIDPARKPSFEQVVDLPMARGVVDAAGGRVTLGACKD